MRSSSTDTFRRVRSACALLAWSALAAGPAQAAETRTYGRIISLAPSLTEVLYAVGAGDQVAGVTRYCIYPPEARKKPKVARYCIHPPEAMKKPRVAGYIDPNYEMIMKLKPDLVLLLHEHQAHIQRLKGMGIEVRLIDQRSVKGIIGSIREIGGLAGKAAEAEKLAQGIEGRLERIRKETARLERPRVLLTVGRHAQAGSLERIFVPQSGSFFGEMIGMAGGRDAYGRPGDHFDTLSREGILNLDPDVVLEMLPDIKEHGITREFILSQWAEVPGLRASRSNRVYVLDHSYVVVPGPRFIDTLEMMAKDIHPGLKLEGP